MMRSLASERPVSKPLAGGAGKTASQISEWNEMGRNRGFLDSLCFPFAGRSSQRICNAVNANVGEASGSALFIMVSRKILQRRMPKPAVRLAGRVALTLDPWMETWFVHLRVREPCSRLSR